MAGTFGAAGRTWGQAGDTFGNQVDLSVPDVHGCVTATITRGNATGTVAHRGSVTLAVTFPAVVGSAASTVENC